MDKLEKLKQLKIKSTSRRIPRLPEEVLIEIFGYLVGRKRWSDLLNVANVCKRWNKLIWSCPRLVDLLKLVIKFENFDRYFVKEIDFGQFETERKYRNVMFSFKSVNSRGDYNDRISISIMEKIVDLHENITTVEIRCMKLEPAHMEILSRFKKLRSLSFSNYSASYCRNVAARYDFKNLRYLKHTNSSTVLFNFMECNQLIKLEIKDICSSDQDNNGNDFVNFLNQLDRCDELTIEIPNWYFKVPLKPKFLWKKLNLKCKYSFTTRTHDGTIAPNVQALCRASTSNAESRVWFSSYQREDLHLWPVVLNNCRGIHTIELTNTVEPGDVKNLNELVTVKTLVINAEALARPHFKQLLLKLPNVTSLEFNTWSKVKLEFKNNTLVSIEPFLNQVTDLKIPYDFVHPVRYKTAGPPKIFEQANFVFKNLQTLTIQPTAEHLCMPDPLCLKKEIVSFCARHPKLHHLVVHVGCPTEIYTYRLKTKPEFKMDDLILGWYKKFYGKTAIKTCDVRIEVEKYNYGLKNWRKVRGITETMLFWRPLTADESRFFV